MKLKDYMELSGHTQLSLAKALGVSTATVSRWLGGSRFPSHHQMRIVFAETKGAVSPNDWVLA